MKDRKTSGVHQVGCSRDGYGVGRDDRISDNHEAASGLYIDIRSNREFPGRNFVECHNYCVGGEADDISGRAEIQRIAEIAACNYDPSLVEIRKVDIYARGGGKLG